MILQNTYPRSLAVYRPLSHLNVWEPLHIPVIIYQLVTFISKPIILVLSHLVTIYQSLRLPQLLKDLGILDVQQIFGRAGRPGFDTQGVLAAKTGSMVTFTGGECYIITLIYPYINTKLISLNGCFSHSHEM